MLLYDGGRAPNPRRVRIFLAEKGLSVPMHFIDINKLDHQTESFRAKNPLQLTPVLELDDGTFLSESIAICRYFEELYPAPPLFGVGALQRAQIEMWQRRLELGLFLPIAHVFRHSHPAMAQMEVPQVPDFAEANRPKVAKALAWINAALADRPYIAGADFSIADITGLVALDFLKPARLTIAPELTHLLDWHARLKSRPSASA